MMPLQLKAMPLADKFTAACLGILPIVALLGNAAADIALALTVVVFLAISGSEIKTYSKSWMLRLSFVFWAWILICSALSMFPAHSFQDSLPWIRFPLYAFTLSVILARGRGTHIKIFISAAALGAIIEFGFMLHEYIYMRQAYPRLHGTFQKFTPGWYLVCFGLIAVLWLFQRLRTQKCQLRDWIVTGLVFVVTSYGMLISGEILNSLIFIVTIVLFFLIQKYHSPRRIIFVLLGVTIFLFIFGATVWFDAALHERVSMAIMTRLPWLSTSDYAPALNAGYRIAELNPIFGVGAKNTFAYCMALKEKGLVEDLLRISECPWHPHNLYLQVAGETGVIGLILFSMIALYIVTNAVLHFIREKTQNNLPIILASILFFPVQSYSQAFGQSKNFYFWTVVGFVLYLIRMQLRERGKDERL